MKHFFAVTALALAVFCVGATAQVKVGIGPRLGLNFATLTSNAGQQFGGFGGTTGYGGRTGMMFGAIVDIGFGNMFGIQSELLYVMKGGSTTGNGFGGATTKALNYFEIPIAFKARWLTGRFIPYSFVGTSIGFNVSAVSKSDAAQGQFGGFGQAADLDISGQTSGSDFALFFGGGLEFKLSSTLGILFDTRYSLGLSNVSNTQFVATQTSESTRGFQIMTGAIFYLGK